ncbi:PD-(D/E)XK nuclease family protein [Corynebacterium aquilae]|uniref:PD-(D/E)XK nuclease family protein n=1 Tax=Corynebacterium aquilae TaxID=203263 RepID=UPI000950F4D5|nr:PD-(D/E)XK nuclease family protein [Corynebacterium aquilae]
MGRFQPLIDAITAAKKNNPLQAIHVLCMPGARDDIITALAAHTPMAGVSVSALSTYVNERSRRPIASRMFIAHHIARLLATDNDASHAFFQAGIADSPATWLSLVDIVERVLLIPTEYRHRTNGQRLPHHVDQLATLVATAAHTHGLITGAEAWEAAAQNPANAHRFAVDILPQTITERDFLRRATDLTHLDTLGPATSDITVVSTAEERDEAAAAVDAVRRALLAGIPPHRIALAYTDDALLAYLRMEAADTPLAGPTLGSRLSEPLIRAFHALTSLDPTHIDTNLLVEALNTNTITTRGGSPNPATLERIARTHPRSLPPVSTDTDDTTATALRWATAVIDDIRRIHAAETFTSLADALTHLVRTHLTPTHAPTNTDPTHASYALINNVIAQLRTLPGALGPQGVAGALELVTQSLSIPREPTTQGPTLGPLPHVLGRDLDLLVIAGTSSTTLPQAVKEHSAITFAQLDTDTAKEVQHQKDLLETALQTASRVLATTRRTSITGGTYRPSRWLPDPQPATATTHRGAAYRWRHHTGADYNLREDAHAIYSTRVISQNLAPTDSIDSDIDAQARRARALHHARTTGEHTGDGREYNGFVGPLQRMLSEQAQFSASALENYANFPYEFFLTHECRAFMPDSPFDPEGINPRDRGTWMHAIVQNFTNQLWEIHPESTAPFAFDPATRRILVQPAAPYRAQPNTTPADGMLDLGLNTPAQAGARILNVQEFAELEQHLGQDALGSWTLETIPPDRQRARELLSATVQAELQQHADMLDALQPAARSHIEDFLRTTAAAWFDHEFSNYAEGWVPLASELNFGTYSDGRAHTGFENARITTDQHDIRIRGSIDRIEFNTHDRSIRLVDYKSGRAPSRTDNTIRLQLPFYGEAFRLTGQLTAPAPGLKTAWRLSCDLTGVKNHPDLKGRYLYLRSLSEDPCVDADLSTATRAEFHRTVNALLNGMAAGYAPPRPHSDGSNFMRFLDDLEVRLGYASYDQQAHALAADSPVDAFATDNPTFTTDSTDPADR